MYALRWRSCDPNQRRIRSAMREETEPLGDPCGRPDAEDGSRRLGLQPGAGFPDGDRRGAAGLGDLVVGALWVALDLELDPRLRADLQALLVVQVLVDGLARHVAPAGQAVELAVLPRPGRRQPRLLDVRREADRHLAAGAGP